MEVIKINRIITAIGYPTINNKLKNIDDIEIINKDIQYQEGIIEILEIDKKIDYIILNQFLPGEYQLEELIEIIREINSNIKIIILLEKFDENLEKILLKKGIYRILKDKEKNIDNLINIIKINEKMKKYNEEIQKEINEVKKNNNKEKNNCKKIYKTKNKLDIFYRKIKNKNKKIINLIIKKIIKKYKNKKYKIDFLYFKNEKNIKYKKNIITILGNNGSGKSIMSILFSICLKKYYKKIIILDFDFKNNSIHSILGVKKFFIKNKLKFNKIREEKIKEKIINNNELKINDLIVKFNKKIDIISNIDFLYNGANIFDYEKLNLLKKELLKKYDLIIIDTGNNYDSEKYKNIINLSDVIYFLTEGNIIDIEKSKLFLNNLKKIINDEKNKIKIIFNKYNKFCVKKYLLKNIYNEYEVVGFINYNLLINYYINKNFRNIFINKYFEKRIYKILIKNI